MEDLYYRWWVLNNPSMGGGEPDGTSTVVTEIKPKYSMKPVVHDQFKLQGYVHYTNIDSVVKETVARYNYHKGDYESLNNRLAEIDWKSELSGMDTEEAWAHLSAILNDKLRKHVPKSVLKKDGRRKIWMTNYRKKQRAWKQYQKSKNYMDYVRATNDKIEFTTLVRNLNRNFERNLAKNLKQNPKDFWRYCKSNLKSKSRLGDLQTMDGRLTSDDKEEAELLNDYFTIEKKLKRLKTTKSAGPDGFHPRVLNELAQSITLSLSIIFAKSYETGATDGLEGGPHNTNP
ncbi:hypothetical protein LSH36_137g01039 [Paralvinella palmiformis]|uniref:Uncharacterized protein n=1 Tax=Paralvinella palmiformis TaxID=53620 RepID=A0AAD9N9R2_9ANNE|nr:hypothetical protein LSH36_137g01039 [Paralvinella palmiformis]